MTTSPYDDFNERLLADDNPNFLWYTLVMLEAHAYAGQATCFRNIREMMEKKYNINKTNPWVVFREREEREKKENKH